MPVVETREVRERQRHISRVFNHFGLSTGPTHEGTKAAVLFRFWRFWPAPPSLPLSVTAPSRYLVESLFPFRGGLAQLGGK